MVQVTPPPVTTAPTEFSHRQILTIIGGLLAGMALASLDQTIVSTALPTIVGDLGGAENIGAVVTAYLLAETVSTPIYGKLSDVYGRKLLFQVAIVVFVGGSMLCGLSQELWQLVAFRAVQGIGAGGLISLAFAAMGDVIPPRQRGRYTGYFSSVFAVTSVIGPLLGGFLTDHVSWRWIFYVNVPIGAVALVVTSRALGTLPRPERRGRMRLDYVGATLLTVAIAALLLVLEFGNEHGWTSPEILAGSIGGVLVLLGWIAWEGRVEDPLVPLRLFRIDVVAVSCAMSFLVGVAMFGAITYLPLYLQIVKGVSASNSGLLLVPLMGGVLLAATLTGRIITRTGRYAFTGPLGFVLIVAGCIAVAPMGTGTPVALVFPVMIVFGIGVGVLSPPLTLAVQNVVDRADIGVATATTMFMRTMGASVGVAVFGVLFSAGIDDETSELLKSPASIDALPGPIGDAVRSATATALHPVFIAGAVIAAVGLLLATRLREVPLQGPGPGGESVAEAVPH